MMNHSQARSIAEGLWGRGGTNSEPTNRNGAFYFSCSGHGGFVIDVNCLTDDELIKISDHVEIETATQYRFGRKRTFMHPYREKGAKVSLMATVDTIRFIVLEEDCAWCLAYKFTGIQHKNKPARPDYVEELFNRYYKDKAA